MDNANPTTPSPQPRQVAGPPRWLFVPCMIVAGAAALIGAYFGDVLPGSIMVFDPWMFALLVLLGAPLALLLWFLLLSGYSRSLRWRTLLAVVLLGGVGCLAAAPFVQFAGFSGGMIPMFEWRFSSNTMADEPKLPMAGERVDLATTTPDDFPHFLGPNDDNRIAGVNIAADWEKAPPKLLWKQPIGEGWAGFAVVGNHAVTIQHARAEEWTTCHDLLTGAMKWKNVVAGRHAHILGGIGPRSTPTIEGGRVYVTYATGMLRCIDGGDGNTLWQHDLLAEFGLSPTEEAAQLLWGRSASPFIYRDAVIVPAGGPEEKRVTVVAYHKVTGAKLWQGGQRAPAYASPSLATIAGMPQILMVSEDFVGSYDAADGHLLWEVEWPGSSSGNANVSNARQVGPDWIFLSKGYGVGARLMDVSRKDGKWDAKKLWSNNRVLRSKFSNVVIKDGYVYALSEAYLECAELATGKKRWTGSRFGYGQILGVGDLLLVLSEDGEVVLVDLSPKEENIRARLQAIEGITWNPPALAGRYLLARNAREAACYELPPAKRDDASGAR